MACVRRRRDKWVLDYRDQHGRRHWETVQGNRKDADGLLALRLHEVGRGNFEAKAEEKTFDEVMAAYKTGHVDVNVRPTTRKDYEALLELHVLPHFKGMKVRAIAPQTVEAWRNNLLAKGVGRRTVNKAHIQLGAMLRYAMRNRWVTYNAATEVPKLREESTKSARLLEGNVLNPEEVRRLLEHAGDRWKALLMMAVSTGLRQGELLGLRWGDIDWAGKQVQVRRQFSAGRFADLKTRHSRRSVGLSEDLLTQLRAWKLRCPTGEHDLVFPHDSGSPLNHGILLRSGFYPALRRAKLRRIRFHDLRHTFASLLIAQNVHPKRIQALMGHSTIRVTMDVYGHLMHDADNEAAEKVAALIGGSKTVATTGSHDAQASQVLEKMEAGVGIEPAYTALQAAA